MTISSEAAPSIIGATLSKITLSFLRQLVRASRASWFANVRRLAR
jgi:hypothetical protein